MLFYGFLQDVLSSQVPVKHQKQVSDSKHLITTLIMGRVTIFYKFVFMNVRNVLSNRTDFVPLDLLYPVKVV